MRYAPLALAALHCILNGTTNDDYLNTQFDIKCDYCAVISLPQLTLTMKITKYGID